MVTRKIDADAYRVSQLFRTFFYVIPEFQREYIWKKKQVTTLLRDLLVAFTSGANEEYFLGSTVVYKEGNALAVVDGQQRLTTLYVLIAACRDQLAREEDIELDVFDNALRAPDWEGKKQRYSYRIEHKFPELGDALKKIGDGKADEINKPKSQDSTFNLVNAYMFCQEFLAEHFGDHPNRLTDFVSFVWDGVELVQIETDDMQQAFTIFETINYRGVTLDAMDLLKNLLLMEAPGGDRSAVSQTWRSLLTTLRNGGENRPVRFLRYFLVSEYGFERMPTAGQIFHWITEEPNRKALGLSTKPLTFARRLEQAAEAYSNINMGYTPKGKVNPHLVGINLQRSGVRQHLCLLLAARHLNETLFNRLAARIETLVFVYAAAGVQWNRLESVLPNWAPQIREIKTEDELSTFLKGDVEPEIAAHLPTLREVLDRTDKLSPNLQRYVLASITQFIENENNRRGHIEDMYKKNISIEHIFPQDPTPEAIGEFAPEQGRDQLDYTYALGNLLLLYQSPNAAASNLPFSAKMKAYKAATWDLSRSVATDIRDGKSTRTVKTADKYAMNPPAQWTPKELEQRHRMMLAIAKDRWAIPF